MTTTVLAYIPSPSQGVWYLGPVPIRAYALFIIIGIIVALVLGDRRWEARGGERGVIYDIALWAVPFGLLGGRLYHIITDWPKYFGDGGAGIVGAFRIWDGGLGIWGAVALGGVGAWIACRRRGIPLPAFGDAIAPGIVLAQAIGRLGNYFNQELYGRPTTLPWGLEIYERQNASGAVSPDLANGVSTGQLDSIVHPTFLYELLWNVLVFAALIWLDRRFKIGHGRLFAAYVAGYCVGRFWIELLRSDQATTFADIRINSFTSTFVFIGAVVYIMIAPKGREDPATLKGTSQELADEVHDDDTSVEDFVKELATVGATTGVVAAAKAAGEADEEDAKLAAEETRADEDADETADAEEDADETAEGETAVEAEAFAADVAGVPADTVAEESAAAGDEEPEGEPESEAAAEAEALAVDVEEAPPEEIAEAVEFAAAGEEPESLGGVGAVEGEEAVEAQEAAPEAHEAAVEGAEEADEVAAELAADQAETAGAEGQNGETEDAETDGAEEATEAPSDEIAEADESAAADGDAEAVGGVGAVEGEEAVEAQEAAPEAHEAAVEGAEEAAEATPPEDEAPKSEPEGEAPETEAPETETPETEAPETEAPKTEAPKTESAPVAEPADESGGRLRRWLRERGNR